MTETTAPPDVRAVGEGIEVLLDELQATGDPGVLSRAEELVRLLMEMYGAGLERVVELLVEGEHTPALRRLVDDRMVASLLVLHGVHPVPVEDRVQAALEEVRPYLGSHAGGVSFTGVDANGVAHIRLQGSCDGCASSTMTVKYAIEKAVLAAAPEVLRVEAEGVADTNGGLLQIGSRPPDLDAPGLDGNGAGWVHLDGVRLLPGQASVVKAEGTALLLCSVAGTLYAYRDSCAACGSSLAGGALDGSNYACGACSTRYDVVLAGRSTASTGMHLDPVPLLPDNGGVKVAIGAAVVA